MTSEKVDTIELTHTNSAQKNEFEVTAETKCGEVSSYDANLDTCDEDEVNNFYSKLSSESIYYLHEKTGHGDEIESEKNQHLHEKSVLPYDIRYFLKRVIQLDDEKCLEMFDDYLVRFNDDPNFPGPDYTFIKETVKDPQSFKDNFNINFQAKLTAALIKYHSPYPEVRATTDFTDDANEPIETIRSYTIGFVWLIIASGIKEFFSHRQPAISLSTMICSVLMFPCGKIWEYIMPDVSFNVFGKKLRLNPGPYGFKEQMFATLIVSVSSANVYVSYNVVTQVKFYKQDWVSFGYQLMLVLSTQFMGFSFAGLLRKFVIYPTRAMWPTVLPTIALNRALLKPDLKENIHGWTITKFKFFWIVFAVMFFYFWIPNYLFTALSTFNWMNWIDPDNFNLSVVCGSVSGLGLFNLIPTFDWNHITGVMDPFALPFMTTLNMISGAFLGGLVILGVYYSNHKWSGYLPINDNTIFTNTGERFDVSRVIKDGYLDIEAYQAYSPPFYSAANIVIYSAFFFVYPFTFMFSSFKEWATIKQTVFIIRDEFLAAKASFTWKNIFKSEDSAKKSVENYDDPHCKMMSKYAEVPDVLFYLTLVISVVLAILTVKLFPETETPVWGIFFVIGINFVFLIPFCLLYAVTGIQYGLNVLVELIVGYAINNGMAMMTLKALGYNIDGQAENYVSAQKIAHYCKIPPRAFFRAQFIGTFVQGFVFLGVVNWSLSNIDDLCEKKAVFSCPNERTYYAASVFWGVIGPKIVFSGLYPIMKYAFLMGFIAGIIFIAWKYFLPKYYPLYFEPTVVLTGILNTYAPYNMSYITGPFYVSFVFMYYIRKRYPAWFAKFTYVLSAALNSSVAFSAVIIFFAVQYHKKELKWWGNDVNSKGVEGGFGRTTLLNISETPRGYFGPLKGEFPTN